MQIKAASVKLAFPKVQVLVQVCVGMCFNVYLCMGVCFSCGPSNGHKAGSVCPLGRWNVHFGQQAASVLLNRSCPSYCTSCTMSFSLSLCLSLFVFLSLWPYTDSVSDERVEESDSDWCCAASHPTTHRHEQRHLNRVETWLWFPHTLISSVKLSHCRGWTQVIVEGELSVQGLPAECLRVWEKRRVDVVKGWWVFPLSLLTWSHKNNKTTWLPHDLFTITEEVLSVYHKLGTKDYYCLISTLRIDVTQLNGLRQIDTGSVKVLACSFLL